MKTTKKVRKTISVSPEVDKALQLLSKRFKKSQSRIIEELVEEKVKELRKEERLKVFNELVEMTKNLRGIVGNKRIQDVNYPASKMRSFGWVYTLFGVPYHHGRVHSTPTPIYPAIQRNSGATFSLYTRL
ncbi:MAG: hypothetical protein DSZ31_00225 [Gammaproteobacteria bacterium]|nr:MAG: hypothetical protein DSZ31_00225 [Gammaproteobacteria bacterium]